MIQDDLHFDWMHAKQKVNVYCFFHSFHCFLSLSPHQINFLKNARLFKQTREIKESLQEMATNQNFAVFKMRFFLRFVNEIRVNVECMKKQTSFISTLFDNCTQALFCFVCFALFMWSTFNVEHKHYVTAVLHEHTVTQPFKRKHLMRRSKRKPLTSK